MPVLLVLGYVWPEPASSAAGWRMLSLLTMFQRANWRIIYASAAEPSAHQIDLTAQDITTERVALNCTSFATQLQQWQPNAVMFDRFMLEEQFGWWVDEYCPNAVKILDSEDLHCLRQARFQAQKSTGSIASVDLNSDVAMREIAAILRCDLTLTISKAEMALLQERYQVPATQLCYCPFMLDHVQSNAGPSFAERQHVSFIGNFRHEPNWQAVLRLAQLWPKLRTLLPKDTELHIYGAYPPPKATALHNVKTGFLVKGWVAQAKDAFLPYRLLVAPLSFGAGLKGKIVEAALYGCPVVTTPIGAEGLVGDGCEDDFPGWIAHNDDEFCQTVSAAYQLQAPWLAKQTKMSPWLAQFDYDLVSAPVLVAVQLALADLSAHRAKHFVGQMLKYHHHRSTKFMGQWIEAKNRLASQLSSTSLKD